MSDTDEVINLYARAANGNELALEFLGLFHPYVHRIDDFIDNREQDPQKFLSILIDANIVYSCPFYVQHAIRLSPIVANLTNTFADSLAWEGDKKEWKRQWADVMRFSGNEMVLAVAMICGGYEHMRSISLVLKELVWMCHHLDGKPI